MTDRERDMERCVEEIQKAEAEILKQKEYIDRCRKYLCNLMELDLNSTFNKKMETEKYKITVKLDPTVKVDEKALAKLDWSRFSKVITTSHKISGAQWRNLSDSDRAYLASAVTTKYNSPSYTFENKETK